MVHGVNKFDNTFTGIKGDKPTVSNARFLLGLFFVNYVIVDHFFSTWSRHIEFLQSFEDPSIRWSNVDGNAIGPSGSNVMPVLN